MVRLNMIIEGGEYPENVSAATASNIESLRQSLHKFFERMLNRDDIQITVFMGAGYRNAAKQLAASDTFATLFVDSDVAPESTHQWFDKLVNEQHPELTITIPDDKMQYVFFMVQEMEAWFLKQPDCLERWAAAEGYRRKDANAKISDHSLIRGKDIEQIRKPSDKLALVMKHFYSKGKKVAQYGKLKTSPGLIDALDVETLLPCDSELQRFVVAMSGVRAS